MIHVALHVAWKSKDGDWTCCLRTLSLVYDGRSRSEAAAFGGVGLQTVRDWVTRFNAGGPEASRPARSVASAAG
jgi:transposase